MDESTLAWMAGFFDGEGSIGGHLSRSRNGRDYVIVRVQISNTDLPSLEIFASSFAGFKIYRLKDSTRLKPYYSPAYLLKSGHRRRVETFLKALEPYSVTKREQIKIGLRLIKALDAGDREASFALRLDLRTLKGAQPKGRALRDGVL